MDKVQYTIPTEITFNAWENDNTLFRDKIGYINITAIRNDSGSTNFANFKTTQKKYLNGKRDETKQDPIVTEGRKTWVHESILERVLRFYGVPEFDVIDKFVNPEYREIGRYKYNKVDILVHLESKYVNGTRFCMLFNKSIWRWIELKTTKKLIKHFSEDKKIEDVKILSKGLGYDSNDIWVPQNLLPMLAIWCSPKYAIFVSDVMNLFHTDPLKLAQMAIQEHDRQNDTHTVAVLHTTDNKEEHDELVARLEAQVDALTSENALVVRDNNHLKDVNAQIEYKNNTLEMDNLSIQDQTKAFITLRNEHGLDAAITTMTNRKEWLDERTRPLEDKLMNHQSAIDSLREELAIARAQRDDLAAELTVLESTYTEEMLDYEEQLNNTTKIKSHRRGKTKIMPKFAEEQKMITSAAPADSCSHISVYTKRSEDKSYIAFVPGRSNNYKKFNFTYKGIINLNRKITAESYISEFNDKKIAPQMYENYDNGVYLLNNQFTSEDLEREFTKYFKKNITFKSTKDDYRISAKDCVTCY